MEILSAAKASELAFLEYAAARGYTKKVVGDYAYSKKRTPCSEQTSIKLVSAKGGEIQVRENGKTVSLPLSDFGFIRSCTGYVRG